MTPNQNNAHADGALGLAAYARSGDWELSIDQKTAGEVSNWFAQIEDASTYLYFEITSPGIVDQLFQFLQSSEGSVNGLGREIQVGCFEGTPVTILQDNEFSDRYFISIGNGAHKILITIAGEKVRTFKAAIKQLVEELKPER